LGLLTAISPKAAEVGAGFNDFRRSTAIRQISVIRSLGVVTEQEVERFSEQTEVQLRMGFLVIGL